MILAYLSLTLSIYTIATKKNWKLMLGSAAIYLPLLLYLSFLPRFEGWALFILLFHLISSYALWVEKYLLAWISLLPVAVFTIWLFLIDLGSL